MSLHPGRSRPEYRSIPIPQNECCSTLGCLSASGKQEWLKHLLEPPDSVALAELPFWMRRLLRPAELADVQIVPLVVTEAVGPAWPGPRRR